MSTRYFVIGAVPGAAHTRYAVLSGRGSTVVGVLISRPDGTEVEQPADVRWRLQPFVGGEVRATWFNNVPPRPRPGPIANAEEHRKRGYERGRFGRGNTNTGESRAKVSKDQRAAPDAAGAHPSKTE
jgi:hypothetical protein